MTTLDLIGSSPKFRALLTALETVAHSGVPRTALIYKMRKLGIETHRSSRARPFRQLADEKCHAATTC
jgi:hypothetical protein